LRKIRKTDKGKLNKLIDDLIHPYFKEYPAMIIVDGLLHAMVEQNPDANLRKFVKYNVPKIIKTLARKNRPISHSFKH